MAKSRKIVAQGAPSWAELKITRKALYARRPHDRFMRKVLKGAFKVALDDSNPIRGNLLAAAMRELATHLLHGMAPDTQVEACTWFTQDRTAHGPTRKQRAIYIAQGGLSDGFVRKQLGLDVAQMVKPLIACMDTLNKLTHMQPDTILYSEGAVRALTSDALDATMALFEAAHACRAAVAKKLIEHIDRALMDCLIDNVIPDLDELSTHTRVEDQDSENVEVVGLDHETITFAVTGQVNVQLQYGSDSDVRNDIGAVMSDSYPYEATLRAAVADPTVLLPNSVSIQVDTSKFYE